MLVPAIGSAASSKAASTTLRTWSYVGPRAELAGATIVLRDRDGAVLATGRTGRHGTHTFRLPRTTGLTFPLSISTTGGRAAGKAFDGTLEARVFGLGPKYAVVQNSLVSTAASHIAGSETRKGYSQAVNRVRRSLGIRRGSLPDVLRLRNGDVGYRELVRASSRVGGFDVLAAVVAERAARGKRVRSLRPRSANRSAAPGQGPTPRVKSAHQSTAPTTSVCSISVPSGSGNTSTEVLEDVGAIGINGLMLYAGVPDVASSSITGMLFAPIGENGSTVQQEDAEAVAQAVTCLSEQLNYVSAQVAALQFSVDLSTAVTTCENQLNGTNGYAAYNYLVANADEFPLNASNASLVSAIGSWNSINTNCGAGINDMLFGTAGGTASTWQQLNKNMQAGLQWYTQAQTQSLQSFLSYWGQLLYWQFILSNEVNNFNGAFEIAASAAGATTNSSGQPVCNAGATAATNTYCVWQSNISHAYPPDLYSDEIAIISSGLAVNASPGGLVAPKPITSAAANFAYSNTTSQANQSYTPTAMNFGWWYNYYLNFTSGISNVKATNNLKFLSTGGQPWCIVNGAGWCPPSLSAPDWMTLSLNAFNNQGANPYQYGSAIQTYWNPQAPGRTGVTSSQLGALTSGGPGGQSSASFFYNAINQMPTPPSSTSATASSLAIQPPPSPAWGSINANQTTYWAADTSSASAIVLYLTNWYSSTKILNVSLGAPVGVGYNDYNIYASGINAFPVTPVIGMLSGRPWWPASGWPTSGSAGASSYVPPAPPTA